MLPRTLLLLVVVAVVYGEVKEQYANVNDVVILTLGEGVTRWERERDAILKERIIYCKDLYDRNLRCRAFVPKDRSELETREKVLSNGSLRIDKAKDTDSGIYFAIKPKGEAVPNAQKEDATEYDAIRLIVKPSEP